MPLKPTSALPLCLFAELPSSEHLSVADATWLALNVVSGGGGFSGSQPIGVTKIAKSVIAPLADQNISVFMLSTYQTDFILVRGHKRTRQTYLSPDESSVGRFNDISRNKSCKKLQKDQNLFSPELCAL